jgi:hypothetical protein
MNDTNNRGFDPTIESKRTLARLLPRIEEKYSSKIKEQAQDWSTFIVRLEVYFPTLLKHLVELYGAQYDFFYHLESLLKIIAQAWLARPQTLKALDQAREKQPNWFQSHKMLGGVCYVDLFAGDLAGIRQSIPYF